MFIIFQGLKSLKKIIHFRSFSCFVKALSHVMRKYAICRVAITGELTDWIVRESKDTLCICVPRSYPDQMSMDSSDMLLTATKKDDVSFFPAEIWSKIFVK